MVMYKLKIILTLLHFFKNFSFVEMSMELEYKNLIKKIVNKIYRIMSIVDVFVNRPNLTFKFAFVLHKT